VALAAIALTVTACGGSHRAPPLRPIPQAPGPSATTAATPPPETTPPAQTKPAAKPLQPLVKPPITWDPIPFGPQRLAETAAYAQRHYSLSTYNLTDPHVIVIHYTQTPDFQSTFDLFAPDTPDPELHELPGVCSHFVIDRGGVIHQLVRLNIMCRHTVGLNWTAIGVEHVGSNDQQVLGNPPQLTASLKLVRWLRCRFHIKIKDVIGHNESLTSPDHREHVAALRTQTHDDFNHADMQIYRQRLRALGGCPQA
jgi:beta-N-acetylhexosaminidase